MKTFREKLAETYPLHFQRILELTYENYAGAQPGCDSMLDDPIMVETSLFSCFIWSETSEGHDYWMHLSRAELFHEG